MLRIHHLFGISHFTKFSKSRVVTVWEMIRNLKSPIPQWWRKWKNDPESTFESNPRANHFYRVTLVPEVTYNVSNGALNPTLPYHAMFGQCPLTYSWFILLTERKWKNDPDEDFMKMRFSRLCFTYPFGAHSASTWQVPQTSTVWFYCRAVYYGCHISLEIVGRVTPKF